MNIVTMQDEVESQRYAVLNHRSGHCQLVFEGVAASKALVGLPVRALETDLDMVQACFLEACNFFLGQADRGCDQVTVEAHPDRTLKQFLQVRAYQWLAAGKPKLYRTEPARLAHHLQPLRCAQFLFTVFWQLQWV